jgi:glyoxylase-like metal-dependent hydrolase (beta-lactamase superfamily II)
MLVYALKYATVPARHEPLVVLGPPGVVRLVKALAHGYGAWLLDPGFPIVIMDVQPGEPFPLDGELTLESFPVPHTAESVALGITAPEGRLVYTGDTGLHRSWRGGPRAATCCSPSARSPMGWRSTSTSRRNRPATSPRKPARGALS